MLETSGTSQNLFFGTQTLPEVPGMIINGPEGCGSDLDMPYNFLSFLIISYNENDYRNRDFVYIEKIQNYIHRIY